MRDEIACYEPLNKLPKVFNSAFKNFNSNQKHFKKVYLSAFLGQNEFETTLQDDTFGDITFEEFEGVEITKIQSNAFSKTANKIKIFWCWSCPLKNQPPNYDLQNVFNQMNGLIDLLYGLNATEIPLIKPIGGQSKLSLLLIEAHQNLTVKGGIFQYLNYLNYLIFFQTTIKKIEKEAFKLTNRSKDEILRINFHNCELSRLGNSFQNGSFDGAHGSLNITFRDTEISYLNKGVFKLALDNNKSVINLVEDTSLIDCEDCRNYWLVKDNKQNQVNNAFCRKKPRLAQTLFDHRIKTKLYIKCKPIYR